MDLLIKGGTIVTAKESFAADVAVKDGKIVAIGKDLPIEAEKVVDASGRLVLPGALDVHTHMAMPFGGTVSADSYLSGTRAAACGGVTTIFDYPVQHKGQTILGLCGYKLDPSDYDCEEEYLDALRSCWQDKYDPSFKTNVDVSDYAHEEVYRNALILDWQETYDSKHQFNGFNFDKFTTIDDYLVEYNDRLNWIKECDAEGKYSKIDASNYDNLIQYKHQINLRKAWKNKYDPNNEHTNINPCDYNSVEEYHDALKRCQ